MYVKHVKKSYIHTYIYIYIYNTYSTSLSTINGKIFYEHAKYFHEPKASENMA